MSQENQKEVAHGVNPEEEKVMEAANASMFEGLDDTVTLASITNNTYSELCRTLQQEQTELFKLEERRKKLEEHLQRLKSEIQEEKRMYGDQYNCVNLSSVALPVSSDNAADFPIPGIPIIDRTKSSIDDKKPFPLVSGQVGGKCCANRDQLNEILHMYSKQKDDDGDDTGLHTDDSLPAPQATDESQMQKGESPKDLDKTVDT